MYEDNEAEPVFGSSFASPSHQEIEMETGLGTRLFNQKQQTDSREGIKMTKKGYKQKPITPEHRKNMSEGMKLAYKEGRMVSWSKGLTKETDIRLKKHSEFMKGRHLTKEHCKKISETLKGHEGYWIKSGKPSPRTYRKYGPLSEEHKRKIGKAGKGRIVSKETRRKIGLAHKGKIIPRKLVEQLRKSNTGLKRTPEFRQKRRDYMLNGGATHMLSCKKNPSKPQKKLYRYIKKIYPTAILNYPIKVFAGRCYSLDIAIPELKIDYEYDSEYWHSVRSHGKHCEIKDFFRDENLIERGWCVVRIKETKELEMVTNV